jgi:4-hydroxybenzoate polyprenyltransferase
MVYQTYDLLLHSTPSLHLIWFVFFSTVCSYNLHWYLTPHSVSRSIRISWAQRHKGWHLFLYFLGLSGSIFYFFSLRRYWLALFVAALFTFLYTAPKLPGAIFRQLKKIAIGKTIFLAFVWTYVTAILPLVIPPPTHPWKNEYIFYVLSRYFLIYAICIPFDYRDREDDKKEGIRSMITYFNESGVNFLFYSSILLFTLFTVLFTHLFNNPFLLIALLVPGVITTAVYPYAKRNFSDYLYYFVLDGLMALSGLLLLIKF